MPRWLTRVLARIHALAANDMVRLTHKAESEARSIDMELRDVIDVLAALQTSDFAERLVAQDDGDWMYVFVLEIVGTTVYVKVVLRTKCIVVSFHEDKESKTHA